jgi:hypothetical protein
MEFACEACGSAAVVYPEHLTDDAPVTCRRCQTVLCTLAEFRRCAERKLERSEPFTRRRSLDQFRPDSGLMARLYRRLTKGSRLVASGPAQNDGTALRAGSPAPGNP